MVEVVCAVVGGAVVTGASVVGVADVVGGVDTTVVEVVSCVV